MLRHVLTLFSVLLDSVPDLLEDSATIKISDLLLDNLCQVWLQLVDDTLLEKFAITGRVESYTGNSLTLLLS